VAATLIAFTAGVAGFQRGQPTGENADFRLRAFWAGAGIYVGTFVVAVNWDYRLIFLLMVTAQLVEWCRLPGVATRRVAAATLLSSTVAMSGRLVDRFSDAGGLPDGTAFWIAQASTWLTLAGLAWLVGKTLPATHRRPSEQPSR
jgi:hypothetical protein